MCDSRTCLAASSGIGALASPSVGGNAKSALVGSGVGKGVGYVIGNEEDKYKAQDIGQAGQSSDYSNPEVGSLGGTRWEVASRARVNSS